MDPRHAIIEWIDECTYKLTYDSTKSELTDFQKMVNGLGGFMNEMIKIEGNCFYFKSTLKYNGGEQSIEGNFCKGLKRTELKQSSNKRLLLLLNQLELEVILYN